MKDYEKDRHDGTAPEKLATKPGGAGGVEGALHNNVSVTQTDAERPGILQQEHLSHPANSGQLADILSGLQQSHGNAYVQQVVSGMSEPKASVEVPATGGQKFDDGVKAEMETAFGESFADVRIHTGGDAERMNEELGARAVTRGRDIYFDAGEYNTATREGKELLAHELTHVVQQKGGATGGQSYSMDRAGDTFEQEADRAATLVARGERVHVEKQNAQAPACQRQSRPGQAAGAAGASVSATVFIDIMARPRDTLPNGVVYTYQHRPREVDYILDFVMPREMRLTVSPPNCCQILNVTGPNVPDRVVDVVVTGSPGRSAEVEITFMQGSSRVVAIFTLPRRPQRGASP